MGYCSKCKGIQSLVLGLAVLANYYLLLWDWWLFVGVVLVVWGAIRMAKPSCPCCGSAPVATKAVPKRRRR